MPVWPFGRRNPAMSFIEVTSITYHLEVQASHAYYAKDWPRAECLCRDILAQGNRESQAMARNMLGRICERQQRDDEAIAYYESNVAERSDLDWTYRRLAIAYHRRGQPAEEERVVQAAMRCLPALDCAWHSERLKKFTR